MTDETVFLRRVAGELVRLGHTDVPDRQTVARVMQAINDRDYEMGVALRSPRPGSYVDERAHAAAQAITEAVYHSIREEAAP